MATVACRQLGLGTAGILKKNAFFGEGTGPTYIAGVRTCHDLTTCRNWHFSVRAWHGRVWIIGRRTH